MAIPGWAKWIFGKEEEELDVEEHFRCKCPCHAPKPERWNREPAFKAEATPCDLAKSWWERSLARVLRQ